ncbi:MAG TPA: S28 family serine protease [Kofleriaceae bacterium]
MRRLALIAVLAACGDNLEPTETETEPTPIEATCSEAEVPQLLAKLPNVSQVVSGQCGDFVVGAKCFEVMINQPVDHKNPSGPTFKQQLFVMHRGCDRPTVIADWGYSWEYFYDDELATLFGANAIWVEHRFQGESVPIGVDWDWKQLTIENGAGDLHRVVESFKHLWGANWVSTGASKGGITATYHSYFYPDDLNGTVPYVAPASRSRLDVAYQYYLDSVMTTPCAQRVRDSQVAALTSRRAMMIARIDANVGVGAGEIYIDLMTAHLDWAFWQYYGVDYCTRVPGPTATDDQFWNFFAEMSGFSGAATGEEMSDGALVYEWMTEQGFALQIGEHVRPLLKSEYALATMEDNFRAQFPEVPLPTFDGSVTRAARRWAELYADNVLLIYGQYDPWSGGALAVPKQPTSARYFVPEATHGGAAIAGLVLADRTAALEHAARMFGVAPMLQNMQRAIEATKRRDAILSRIEQRHVMRLP